MSDYASATEDGFTVTSNTETAEQITETLKPEPSPEPEPDKPVDKNLSKAASTLGKKGGEAAAAKRAEAAKEAQTSPETDGTHDEPVKPTAEEPEKPLGKPRDDPRARMLEATRKEAEAKRERDAIKAERDRLAAEIERLRSGKPSEEPKKAAPSADSEPQEADYDDYKEFVKATARWEFRQAQKEAQKAEQVTARDREISTALDTFFKRVEEHEKTDPEFKTKAAEIAQMLRPSFILQPGEPVGPLNVMADEVVKSERAPALMLHFQEHPEEIQRISALRTPGEVQVEVRLLARTLAAAPTATAPKVEQSQAKPPLRPVSGSPHTADVAPDPDSASFDEHLRFYNAKERRAR